MLQHHKMVSVTLLMLGVISAASAGTSYKSALSFHQSADERFSEEGYGVGLGIGYTDDGRLSYEAELQWGIFEESLNGTPGWREIGARGSLLWRFRQGSAVQPFFDVGVSVVETRRLDIKQSYIAPALDIGGGFSHPIGLSGGSLRLGLRLRSLFYDGSPGNSSGDAVDFLEGQAFVALVIGKKRAPKQRKRITLSGKAEEQVEAAVVELTQMEEPAADHDGDGVADEIDICASTPRDVDVYANGCELPEVTRLDAGAFDVQFTRLNVDGRRRLDILLPRLQKIMARNLSMKLRIEGHGDVQADAVDAPSPLDSAQAVRGYLILMGIAPARVGLVDVGGLSPLSSSDAVQMNRRVDIRLLALNHLAP